jgi:hypothetical protein
MIVDDDEPETPAHHELGHPAWEMKFHDSVRQGRRCLDRALAAFQEQPDNFVSDVSYLEGPRSEPNNLVDIVSNTTLLGAWC